MNKSLRHALYITGGIVILIIALLFFWWFTLQPIEPFISAAPYVIMVGITSGGDLYYADIDVPMKPKWVKSSLTGVGDIAGSYGTLYTVPSAGAVPKYGPYDSGTQTTMPGSIVVKNISADDNGPIAGIGGTSTYGGMNYYASTGNSSAMVQIPGGLLSISVSGGDAYCVGAEGTLYYKDSSTSTSSSNSWVSIKTGTWKQVSMDAGVVCAIKTDGTVFCADSNIANTSVKFVQQGTKLFNSICIKGGRLVGVATDGKVYYSNTYLKPTWSEVATATYNTTTGAAGTAVSFTKVIMMYPPHSARRKRLLGSAKACNSNEELIKDSTGSFCYQPCPSGRPANGKQCPYMAKRLPAIATCDAGTEFINNSCYKACQFGYTANGNMCDGATVPKPMKPLNPAVTPASYDCGDGSVGARYIRVRPSPLIANNKLCIKGLTVTLSRHYCFDAPSYAARYSDLKNAYGDGTTDASAAQLLNHYKTSGMNEGRNPCKDTEATSTRVSKATDGTCADAPIGGTSCGAGAKYLSGKKYDTDADGGQQNRTSKVYWELDLGSMKQVKQISFTGCAYILPDGTESTAPIGTPNADQITGTIIELYKTNTPEAAPIASRTLGPEQSQTIIFNYIIKDALMPNRCFDTCPKINGVQSAEVAGNKCLAAAGGITNRAVTSPIRLPDPVCGAAKNAAGNIVPYSVTDATSGTAINITNFVPDPDAPGWILSCDNLPNSIMRKTTTILDIPYISKDSIANSISAYNSYNTTGIKAWIDSYWAMGGKPGSECFDAPAYAARYTDLKASFGDGNTADSATKLRKHYDDAGLKEGRNPCKASDVTVREDKQYSYTAQWTNNYGTPYTNSEANYMCVDISTALCPANYVYYDTINACIMSAGKSSTALFAGEAGKLCLKMGKSNGESSYGLCGPPWCYVDPNDPTDDPVPYKCNG